jgi:hypothetical protein
MMWPSCSDAVLQRIWCMAARPLLLEAPAVPGADGTSWMAMIAHDATGPLCLVQFFYRFFLTMTVGSI